MRKGCDIHISSSVETLGNERREYLPDRHLIKEGLRLAKKSGKRFFNQDLILMIIALLYPDYSQGDFVWVIA